MSTHTDKIRAALTMAHSAFRENVYAGEDQLAEALAALSELEAQPQPANDGAEPVAWTTGTALGVSERLAGTPFEAITAASRNLWGESGVPLYTTPQPAKVLTDEQLYRQAMDDVTPEALARMDKKLAAINGYLALAEPSQTGRDLHSELSTMDMLFALHKVIAEFRDKRQHGDLFFQPLGGQAERLAQLHDELDAWLKTAPAQPPAPTVDQMVEIFRREEEAWGGFYDDEEFWIHLRSRLTKLMQP